jgi:cell division protein FtsQ
MPNKKYNIKKIIFSIIWVLVGIGCLTLLISAVRNKEMKKCKAIEIEISGVDNNFFIDKNDVYNIIKQFGGDSTQNKSLAAINVKLIERELEKDIWIKNAELFFDNNNVLKVMVNEREPIARIFTSTGSSFYIDSSCKVLPISNKFSARLPIFTGFTSDAKMLTKLDSSLLKEIKNISIKIIADTFLMAMIDQIDIAANQSFEMVPKIGKQIIYFGDAMDIDAKFSKLKLFYKNIIAQSGWNRYSTISLQYAGQVVATLRGKADIASDSLKTLQLMQFIADEAARKSADSAQSFLPDAVKNNSDSSLIEQSIEREDEGIEPANAATMMATKPEAIVLTPAIAKPVAAPKPATIQPQSIPIKPPIKKPATTKPVTANAATAVVVKPKPVVKKPAITMPAKPVIKKPVLQQKPKPVVKKPANEY